jgi:DNA mismatch repair protein MutL
MTTETKESRIQVLPEHLINQIAAGEVVDRPSAVVKELVENALDSGADKITVIVGDGGKRLIRVVDNGIGMSSSDFLLAFQRHATSKILTYEDLENIVTLGFRGEALASIASVARVEARTMQHGESSGHLLQIDGGVMSRIEAAAGTPGTSITVRHLFYNTPARRKFLRARNTEYRQILNVMNRFYLAYPEVAFTFVNEDEVTIELFPETPESRITNVLGRRVKDNLIALDNEHGIKISGYIGNQDAIRKTRGDQYLYYNRRFFNSKNLSYAVAAAYGEILPRGLFPVYVIFIEMEPNEVDVNVHPTKLEIKFANEQLVFSSLRGAVKRALTSHAVIPEISPWQPYSHFDRSGRDSSASSQSPRDLDLVLPYSNWKESEGDKGQLSLQPDLPLPESETGAGDAVGPAVSGAPDVFDFERRNIWQVHNKYIVSQIKSGLIIVDQHVAHERILYEQALESFEKRTPSPQQLLFPQIIELSAEDNALLLEILPFLERIGFIVKAFGQNTVVVEAVPSGVKFSDDERALLDIIDEYKRGKKDNVEIRENVAASFACHSAIRAGESLSLEAMNALIDDLFSTREPYFCPHGRPVIIHVPLEELDRRFKRT